MAWASEFTLLRSFASASMPNAPVVLIVAPVASPDLPMMTLTVPQSSARLSRLATEAMPAPPAVSAAPDAVWVADASSLTLCAVTCASAADCDGGVGGDDGLDGRGR